MSSVLHLLGWCYRLTSAAKAVDIQHLCFAFPAILHVLSLILWLILIPSFLHFLNNYSTPHFPAFLPDRFVFISSFSFKFNLTVPHATLCYDTVYCTGLLLQAGLFQVNVFCRARELHKLFVVKLEGFPHRLCNRFGGVFRHKHVTGKSVVCWVFSYETKILAVFGMITTEGNIF